MLNKTFLPFFHRLFFVFLFFFFGGVVDVFFQLLCFVLQHVPCFFVFILCSAEGFGEVREFFCRQKESEQRLESGRFRINLKTLFSPYNIFCVSTGITVMAFTGQAFWHAPQPMQPLASICGKPPFFRQII